MQNPFTGGSYRQTRGQADSPERPDRVKPVPEHVEAPAFPYRGSETHGVPIPHGVDVQEYYENNTWEDGEDAEKPLPALIEEEPVPVRIVQKTGRELADFRTGRFVVTGPQMILGRHDKRSTVYIKVNKFLADGVTANTNPVYIGYDSGVQPYTGYRLDVGDNFPPIESTEAIWATVDAGVTAVEISVIYEFGVEL